MSNPILKDIKTVAQGEQLIKETKELMKSLRKEEKQKGIDIIKKTLSLDSPVKFHLNKKIVSGVVYSISKGNSIGVEYTDIKGKTKIVSKAIINLPEQTKK